jgi:hypothetical protein
MILTGFLDSIGVATEKRVNINEVLEYGCSVSLQLISFVPLIVVMEYEADNVVKVIDEAVRRDLVYEAVKLVVETGKVVVPSPDTFEQVAV